MTNDDMDKFLSSSLKAAEIKIDTPIADIE